MRLALARRLRFPGRATAVRSLWNSTEWSEKCARGAAPAPASSWDVGPFSLHKSAEALRQSMRDEVLASQASDEYAKSETLPLPFGAWAVSINAAPGVAAVPAEDTAKYFADPQI